MHVSCLSVQHVCGDQKKAVDSLELKFGAVVGHCVGAGN